MDWKRYRVIIMGAVALALVATAWVVVQSQTGDTQVDPEEEELSFPEIEQDNITEVMIRRPDDDADIRLVRDGESWRVTEPVDAPAATSAVNTLLEKLSGLELAGRAASRAELHERLEVAESNGIHVIAKNGGETLIDMWVGAFQSGNTMVRIEGDDNVLMARGSIKFAFNKPVRDWRDRAILELTAADVNDLRFANENGTFHVHKASADEGGEWAQVIDEPAEGEEPAEPIEEFTASRVTSLVTGIARLRAADFAGPEIDEGAAGLGEGAARAVIVSGAGEEQERVGITIGNEVDAGQRYLRIDGDETIYVVSRYIAERLMPNVEAFQPAAAPDPGEAPPTPPPGGGAGGPPGGGQIPPEIMQQLQRQLQQQGGH